MSLSQEEQAEIIQDFERSRRLHQTITSAGWADVLDVMEAQVDKAEFRLVNLDPGSDPKLVSDVLMSARAYRSIFEQVQLQIARLIERGIDLSQLQGEDTPQYNNF